MKRRRRTGMSLLELMGAMAILLVVSATALGAYYQLRAHSHELARVADDIIRTVRAGERWREDVRAATGPIVASGETVSIPTPDGTVVYRIVGDEIHRTRGSTGVAGVERRILDRVHASEMTSIERHGIAAWSWELELAARHRRPRVLPRFTFRAVPGNPAEPREGES